MPTTVRGGVQSNWSVVVKKTGAGLSDGTVTLEEVGGTRFQPGSGSGQTQRVVVSEAQLGTSAQDDFDLDAGTLTDPFGDAQTFTNVKGLRCRHKADSDASAISLEGDFITTHLGAISLPPGAEIQLAFPAGLAVTASTADVVTVLNEDGSNAADYVLEIVGA